MFRDRRDAGVRLAARLKEYADREGLLILALPRGGVVVADEIARRLRADMDVLIVRKIGVPWQPELAAGALSETGTVVMNPDVVSSAGGLDDYIDKAIEKQREEISRRIMLYRNGASLAKLEGKTVILVDDGVATGATMKAAIQTLKNERLARLIVAIPVAPPETAAELERSVDEFVCLDTPAYFMAVGSHYLDFNQVTDEEVVHLLRDFKTGLKSRAA